MRPVVPWGKVEQPAVSDTEKACLLCQEERRRPVGPKSQNAYKLVLHTVTRKLLTAIQ